MSKTQAAQELMEGPFELSYVARADGIDLETRWCDINVDDISSRRRCFVVVL